MTSIRGTSIGGTSVRGTRWRARLPWLAGPAVALAGLLVVVLTVGAAPVVALGARDPGLLVRVAGPVARLTAQAAGTVCLGALVFALVLTRAGADGALSARAWAAVRTAGRAAAVWAVAAFATAWFTLATVAGDVTAPARLVTSSSPGEIWAVLAAGEEPVAWLLTALLAAAVAVGCRGALAWATAAGLAVLAALALLPPAATGHASSQAGHDLAIPALFWHVLAAAVWVGTLVAVARRGWSTGPGTLEPAATARRYTRIATGCWAVLTVSGLVDAAVLLGRPDALVTTPYGWVLLAVTALTAALGLLGWRWRRRCLAAGRRAALVVGELGLLAVTAGLSVASTVLVPPAWAQRPTALQTLLGYDLDGPPTLARLLLDGRPDVVFLPVAVLAAALYLVAVRRLRAAGLRWPPGRTAAWLAGCAVLVLATGSGIGRYAPAMFSLHMTMHMLLSTVAPFLLVLGAPVVLLRRACPPAEPGSPVGLRDAVDRVAASGPGRVAARPVAAYVAFVGAPFVFYLTSLFDAGVRYRWADLAGNAVFLGIGLAFAAATVGTAARSPAWARVALLLASMPPGALFAAVLATTTRVVGDGEASSNMYSSLALPWTRGDLLGDQRVAAVVSLGLGEAALVAALAVVLVQWDRSQGRREGAADAPATAAARAVTAARAAAADPTGRADPTGQRDRASAGSGASAGSAAPD